MNIKVFIKDNVALIQGTTNLLATKAVTLGDEKNQLVLATASGIKNKQAHFWTTTDPKKPLLHAYADIIRYYPQQHLIKLTGNARVEQGNNSFSAAQIRARLGISYLPQEASVFRKLSVADNIMAILELRADLSKQAREEKLDLLLQEFHITHLHKSMGLSLSGGERRRVEIARALAIEPHTA